MGYVKPVLTASALVVALGCRHAAPPPAPPASPQAPISLEQSMQFLQDKLGAIGQVNFSLNYRDPRSGKTWVEKFSPEVTGVQAGAANCRIDYDWRWVQNGQLVRQARAYVALREAREVEVLPAAEATREKDAQSGYAGLVVSAEPPVFVVRVDRPGTENNFPFYDEALARRVAAELSRAVEFCGGRAPFAKTPKVRPAPGEKASLEVTMKWIADALESIGPVNYTVSQHSSAWPANMPAVITHVSAENTHVRADAVGCRLDWHMRRVRNSAVLADRDVGIDLKDIRGVEVTPAQDGFHEWDGREHRPAVSYRVAPSTFMLSVRAKSGFAVSFPVLDSDFAWEIASALSRAVGACGGGLERY